METYHVTNIDVIDGDTVRAVAKLVKRISLPVQVTTSILGIEMKLHDAEIVLRGTVPLVVRVAGVDTPEMHGEQRAAGEVVKAAVIDWFAENGPCEIVFGCRDKYAGRTVGDFHSRSGGESLSRFLLREKLAKPYDGGKKERWTAAELAAISQFAGEPGQPDYGGL